jgi:hydroxymethylbilane synthase
MVALMLEHAEPGLKVELVEITTSGDERAGTTGPSSPSPAALAAAGEPGDKSRFVKEIEEALLAGNADLAVHSAKDVPGQLPGGLAIVGVPVREDARDALCGAESIEVIPRGARVGTSSLRRRSQVLLTRDDLEVVELRGNVDTRLRRLARGDVDVLVLALAGLRRLGRTEGTPIPAETMTPAPGQGCLVLEGPVGDDRVADLAGRLTDRDALVSLTAERAVMSTLEATCRTPVGAHAALRVENPRVLTIDTFVGRSEGDGWIRDRVEGGAETPAELGCQAAKRLLAAGAGEMLISELSS